MSESSEVFLDSLEKFELVEDVDYDNVDPASLVVVFATFAAAINVALVASYGGILHTAVATALVWVEVEAASSKSKSLTDIDFEREQLVVDIIESME